MLYVLFVEIKNKTDYKTNPWFIVGKMIVIAFIYLAYVVQSLIRHTFLFYKYRLNKLHYNMP